MPRSDSPSVRIVVEVKNAGDTTCSARAAYEARLDTLKLDTWTNARDTKWASLHTSGDHVVNVDR